MAKLFLFGTVRLELDGRPVKFSRRKSLFLLAYLALHPGRHARAELASIFWGDGAADAALLSLRVAVSELRKALGGHVFIGGQALQLASDYAIWVDALEFQRFAACAAPDDWQVALDYYTSDLLSDIEQDWVLEWRSRLKRLYIETMLRQAGHQRSLANYAQAIDLARRVLARDPANENAHQQIMICHEVLGDRSAALQQYADCENALQTLLGSSASVDTRAIFKRVQRGMPRIENQHPNKLPVPLTSFIGRERELETVESWLIPEHSLRLVTLTGAGGSGKTRLSIQIANQLICQYPDGIWWIELAALTRACDAVGQIASVCGINEVPTETLETSLLGALQTRQCLLVLDN